MQFVSFVIWSEFNLSYLFKGLNYQSVNVIKVNLSSFQLVFLQFVTQLSILICLHVNE